MKLYCVNQTFVMGLTYMRRHGAVLQELSLIVLAVIFMSDICVSQLSCVISLDKKYLTVSACMSDSHTHTHTHTNTHTQGFKVYVHG